MQRRSAGGVEPKATLYAGRDARRRAGDHRGLDTARPVDRAARPTSRSFTRQKKIVLENCGKIDPERIEDYIAAGGYQALVKALTR